MAVSATQSLPCAVTEADQWAETDFSTVKFTYSWTIHKFGTYLQAARYLDPEKAPHVLKNASFSSGQPGDGVIWSPSFVLNAGTTSNPHSKFKLALLKGSNDYTEISAGIGVWAVVNGSKQAITYPSFTLYKVGQEYICSLKHAQLTHTPYISADGNLTLFCEIQVQRTDKPQNTFGKKLARQPPLSDNSDPSHLSQDFGSLLERGLFSDVTIMAGGKEFKVHRAILSTRSPVFRAMFDHDMRESVQNQVAIDDLSPEVVQEMLTFIYTDQSPNLNKMPGDLLRAADKYDLKQLKARSERELADRVSPENLVNTLLLADQHSATELREVCMKQFTIHAEEVVKTEGWSKLIQSGHQLITELFVRVVKK